MTNLKLKKWVVPSIYMFSIVALFLSVILIGKTINNNLDNKEETKKVTEGLIDESQSVVNTEEPIASIIKPYNIEPTVIKNFYSKDSEEKIQQQSLIFYEDTYMPNSGILYSFTEPFDVLSVLEGTVSNVKEDEALGKIIEITHNNNLITTYQSLSETSVNKGDSVSQGQIIGKSGANKIDNSSKNELLFEVQLKGLLINPETFYSMTIEELNE